MGRSNMHEKADGKKFEYARKLRQQSTFAESILWEQLRRRKLRVKFRRQHPIANYIVDFFCFEKRLIIEIDGGIHKSREVRQNDIERESILQSMGYTFLRFTNEEVERNIFEVIGKIQEKLKAMS